MFWSKRKIAVLDEDGRQRTIAYCHEGFIHVVNQWFDDEDDTWKIYHDEGAQFPIAALPKIESVIPR